MEAGQYGPTLDNLSIDDNNVKWSSPEEFEEDLRHTHSFDDLTSDSKNVSKVITKGVHEHMFTCVSMSGTPKTATEKAGVTFSD
jgi:hypothetical protein